MNDEKLKQLLDGLPATPGVYLMRGRQGRVLYVGKAKSLRARVRSYFSPGTTDTRAFVASLRHQVRDIDVVLTNTEKEALLLEHNLIREHRPRYNIDLRDDKEYLSLRLDRRQRWPRLQLVRRPRDDGALYFGPYHSASAARATVRLVGRHFKLRSCTDRAMANRARPCLQHQIRRCYGPCTLDVDHDEYMRQVDFVRLFLLGRLGELKRKLEGRMSEAAAAMEYELAAVYRDQIAAVEATLAPQHVTALRSVNQDVVGLHRLGDRVQVAVLEVREGRMIGRLDFHFKGLELADDEVLSSFVARRYLDRPAIPDEVIVSRRLGDAALLAEVLGERRGKKMKVIHPRRGPRVEQAKLADMNARQQLERHLGDEDDVEQRLAAVQRRLRLPRLPRRIECVDISHLAGGDAVGAISAVVDGAAKRSDGRTYKLRRAPAGDDYAAMHEVLTRRFTRARAGETGWSEPDLLVVDGGRGQLRVAVAVLEELGIEGQPLVALAKARESESGDGTSDTGRDRVFLVGRKNPIVLRAETSPLHLLALARDEAHRLAVRYQRKVRGKRALASPLDEVPGVGPVIRKALLRRLGSLKKIRAASIEELATVPGVGPALARRVREALG